MAVQTQNGLPGNVIVCNPRELLELLRLAVERRQSVIVWGLPGIGKSQLVWQLSEMIGYGLNEFRAATADASDARGLPLFDRRVLNDTEYTISRWTRNTELLPLEGNRIVFLDEVNRAPLIVQNSLFQLLDQRRIGDHKIPDSVALIAACNPDGSDGGVTRMPPALRNRFLHLYLEPSLQEWLRWAMGAGISALVIAYLQEHPDALYELDKSADAWPSPRSWERLSRLLSPEGSDTWVSLPDHLELALAAGTVGQGRAMEVVAYKRLINELPRIADILRDPRRAKVPDIHNLRALWAVTAGLAQQTDATNFGQTVIYFDRLPSEFAALGMQTVTSHKVNGPLIKALPEFKTWALAHAREYIG